MRALLHILLMVSVVSCTTQMEKMTRADGSTYSYVLNKIGGQAAAESSSGTKLVVNDENSFQSFCNLVGMSVVGWTTANIAKAMEISKQVAAQELTKQQAQQQMAALQQAELAAKAGATSEAFGAGAEATVLPVTPP